MRNRGEGNSQGEAQPQAGRERADVRQKVWQAAAGLPARYRRALLLREIEGLTYAGIGQTMDLSLENAGKLLHQARLRFRQAYSRLVGEKETTEKCRRLTYLLSAYHDGELGEAGRQRVDDHLGECADCQRTLDKLQSTSELVATLVPTPAPPGLAEKLFSQVSGPAGELRPIAAGGGRMWRLPLMLLLGGAFIAGVVAVALVLWDDSEPSSRVFGPIVPAGTTATPTPTATRGPSAPSVLTPAATPLPQETITPTPKPSPTASPSPTPGETAIPAESPTLSPPATPSFSPTAEATPQATPETTPEATPTLRPTPSPTPESGPGGVRGLVTCQGEAVAGASVTVSVLYPARGTAWSGATGADGSFDSGLILDPGSYLVSILSPGAAFDSVPVSVSAGGYADAYAECTTRYTR